MKILVTSAFNEVERLKQDFNNDDFLFAKDESEMADIDKSSIDYVICNNFFQKNNIRDFSSLKYIQVTSAGLDRLPMKYINDNNIMVFNARGVYSVPMAEWAICKILDVYKKSFMFYENQKINRWEKNRDIEEVYGKNVTIVGFGSVGKEVAKRLAAFGCRITAVDKYPVNDDLAFATFGIKQIQDAVVDADIIILTLPLTDETKYLFDEKIFKSINKKPVLVNMARGQIIKTEDLLRYAESFRAIILDVFENEPLGEGDVMWGVDNIIVTPHNSFVSDKNDDRLYKTIVDNIKAVENE